MAEMSPLVAESTWVACANPKPHAKLRLFALPYAGAGTTVFRTWNTSLPADVELCAIRIPGRETRLRERPFVQIGLLVRALAQALQPFLDKPYALYGHSMGALVAFELARHLRRQGQMMPEHLLVSARRAPQLPDVDEPLHMLDDGEFVDKMQKRYEGIPAAILQSPELMALFLPVLKADFSVIETYEYSQEDPLDFPISAFAGTQDRVMRPGDLDGWREQTSSDFSSQQFTGGHFFIQNQQAVFLAEVSKKLAMHL